MKETLTLSARNKSKKIKYDMLDDITKVEWGTSKFTISNDLYNDILEDFFENTGEWYPLESCSGNPTEGGLGEFIENLKCPTLNSRHASAIAAIMYNEGLIDYRKVSQGIEIYRQI